MQKSGLRLGVFFSKNELLVAAMSNSNMLCQASNLTQIVAAKILDDDAFVSEFLGKSR